MTLTIIEQTERIVWMSQFEYDQAVDLARKHNKPLLLDFYSESCRACRELDWHTLSNPLVAARVNRFAIPVRIRVESKDPNPITDALVASHIFIWSPTVQLVSPDGNIYHKFIGAPRHTRLDTGFSRVHHDVDGHLPPVEFLAQFELALGKKSLFEGEFCRANNQFAKVCEISLSDSIACKEATYWQQIANHGGAYPDTGKRRATRSKTPLARGVERFCEALVQIPDSQLTRDWKGKPNPGDWAKYSDCLRGIVFGTYQQLLDLAIEAAHWREAYGQAQTRAQRILCHHHLAYRELQGVLVGLKGEEVDKIHLRENLSLGKQRTIRNHYVHTVMAEWWAFAPQIRNALRIRKGDLRAGVYSPQETIDRWGEPPYNFGDLGEVIELSERVHQKLLREFAAIADNELDASSRCWEDQPISIRFRLNRLGWHLHDHIAEIETVLERIGRKRTETERLAWCLYCALGQVEGALIGLSDEEQRAFLYEIIHSIAERADELEAIANNSLRG